MCRLILLYISYLLLDIDIIKNVIYFYSIYLNLSTYNVFIGYYSSWGDPAVVL